MDRKELFERIKADGVKFISYQFIDVFGTVKSVDAPVRQLESALDTGVWFDGSSVEGFARIQESDMHLRLDTDTYAVLPWSPTDLKRARIFCDIYTPEGKPFPGDPRGALKASLAKLKERGWKYNIGPEPEFFLFRRNDLDHIHPVPYDVGGYFDFSPNDDAVRVRTELMAALDQMGLEVELGHHECALAQHEIDFRYTDALQAADNILTVKYTVKAIAAQHGLIASFMPKPIFGTNGSGMHIHQSLFNEKGENLFFSPDDRYYLSDTAYGFIAGQLNHARGYSALVAPTINSYKRLVPGYEAPVYVGWAQVNRSALIRIPRYTPGQEKSVRAELRCPDPSCNPYMALAATIAAALDGIDKNQKAPAPLNEINVYDMCHEDREQLGVTELPGSLREALDELEADEVIMNSMPSNLLDTFIRAKRSEWNEYRIHVYDWEIEKFLETA
ncbi:MAG TPA: type I glutamate--ammonia ligase [Bellilinea sp.]|nr:type I glutamate--ammonia ligase [Bellilinea sp.]